jgi:hypothetical protein
MSPATQRVVIACFCAAALTAAGCAGGSVNPVAQRRPSRLTERIERLVRPPRLERGTPGLEGRCSIQLSYGRTWVEVSV